MLSFNSIIMEFNRIYFIILIWSRSQISLGLDLITLTFIVETQALLETCLSYNVPQRYNYSSSQRNHNTDDNCNDKNCSENNSKESPSRSPSLRSRKTKENKSGLLLVSKLLSYRSDKINLNTVNPITRIVKV